MLRASRSKPVRGVASTRRMTGSRFILCSFQPMTGSQAQAARKARRVVRRATTAECNAEIMLAHDAARQVHEAESVGIGGRSVNRRSDWLAESGSSSLLRG